MPRSRAARTLGPVLVGCALLACAGCESYPFPIGASATARTSGATSTGGSTDGAVSTGQFFTEQLIQDRTFIAGTSVTTIAHRRVDTTRTRYGIDFNSDGKIDPVVAYGGDQAVIQILYSQGDAGDVDFISLTLDSKRDMTELSDVAVGDIDGDGALDIVGGAKDAVWYFHHPTGLPTTDLRSWGNQDPLDELHERIGSSAPDPNDPSQNLQAVITQAIGPGVNLDDYIVSEETSYTNVEIADFDNDGDNDVASSRMFRLLLTPRPDVPVEPILIIDGDVVVFENPGFATDGHDWTRISVGRHERQLRLDRDGATGLLVVDMDGDGDLDVVSSARDDNNAQVVWFENPGGALNPDVPWTQWRIGSVRDAWSIDVADITGDGLPDVAATGGSQMQLILFVQPADGPKRTYDWDSHVLVDFESFEPRDVKVLDIDNDGVDEIVVSGTSGTIRYFERTPNVLDPWIGELVLDAGAIGDVGLLGYGDLDGDGDFDLVAVIAGQEENDSRILWVRNDLAVP